MEEIHFKILVPNLAAGAIIGKGGEAIETIKRQTGSRLKMSRADDFYPGTTERVCLIVGSINSCMLLHDYIMEKMCERPQTIATLTPTSVTYIERHKQVKILVPDSTAGIIIGKRGAFVEKIKQETGAFVQVSQRSKEVRLFERCIVVTGELKERRSAVEMILHKIAEDPESASYPHCSYAGVHEPVASAFPTGSPFANPITDSSVQDPLVMETTCETVPYMNQPDVPIHLNYQLSNHVSSPVLNPPAQMPFGFGEIDPINGPPILQSPNQSSPLINSTDLHKFTLVNNFPGIFPSYFPSQLSPVQSSPLVAMLSNPNNLMDEWRHPIELANFCELRPMLPTNYVTLTNSGLPFEYVPAHGSTTLDTGTTFVQSNEPCTQIPPYQQQQQQLPANLLYSNTTCDFNPAYGPEVNSTLPMTTHISQTTSALSNHSRYLSGDSNDSALTSSLQSTVPPLSSTESSFTEPVQRDSSLTHIQAQTHTSFDSIDHPSSVLSPNSGHKLSEQSKYHDHSNFVIVASIEEEKPLYQTPTSQHQFYLSSNGSYGLIQDPVASKMYPIHSHNLPTYENLPHSSLSLYNNPSHLQLHQPCSNIIPTLATPPYQNHYSTPTSSHNTPPPVSTNFTQSTPEPNKSNQSTTTTTTTTATTNNIQSCPFSDYLLSLTGARLFSVPSSQNPTSSGNGYLLIGTGSQINAALSILNRPDYQLHRNSNPTSCKHATRQPDMPTNSDKTDPIQTVSFIPNASLRLDTVQPLALPNFAFPITHYCR